MTRTVAILIFPYFEKEPPTAVFVTGIVAVVIAAVFIRVYFAVWYARDKERSGTLGLLALLGWREPGQAIATTDPTLVP